uniref:Uncharacterized protein n=1 Tax=Branchiostoma floridae TaxID=7739 RepID=C3Z707_BRAFL|eukprot:XP_002595591.1 hypothetical protein BRAFLDRAFT_64701 [Branchiostoma floridae]
MIGWRTFQALEEDDKRLRYARYVFIAAVIWFALGLTLALTVEPQEIGVVLAVLPVPVLICYPVFNCCVSMQIQNRRRANQRRPGVPPTTLLNLYPQTTTPASTRDSFSPGTSNDGVDASFQADLPTYHEARSQQYPDAPPPRPNTNNEPPPPSYEDAVEKR